ncbi:MAG: NAD(P)-dependent oxidoreductase [Sphaerobacteraceae bacterium]|nr:MAG: NAD(P)-dependent oxidoreductase [Sphaerobacteraceae bacterium]
MTTKISSVGLLSPGDMGHSVGKVLVHNGMPVHTCLAGRSERSAQLASAAGLTVNASFEELVQQVDLFLSIVPPARATGVAQQIADAVKTTGTTLIYLDCNAISPETTREVGRIVEASGVTFIDGGIIGAPPKVDGAVPRIYVSGPDADQATILNNHGLDVRPIGDVIGHASGVKMCYAALTKGLTALGTELMVAAEAMGLTGSLREEFELSQSAMLEHLEKSVPGMPPKAYRWVGEMEEIAKTFDDVGLTPKMLLGAADMYTLVGQTPLANETPETRTRGKTLQDVVEILNEALPKGK